MSDDELKTTVAVLKTELRQLQKQMEEVHTTLRWINRVILTGFLGAIMTMVLQNGPL